MALQVAPDAVHVRVIGAPTVGVAVHMQSQSPPLFRVQFAVEPPPSPLEEIKHPASAPASVAASDVADGAHAATSATIDPSARDFNTRAAFIARWYQFSTLESSTVAATAYRTVCLTTSSRCRSNATASTTGLSRRSHQAAAFCPSPTELPSRLDCSYVQYAVRASGERSDPGRQRERQGATVSRTSGGGGVRLPVRRRSEENMCVSPPIFSQIPTIDFPNRRPTLASLQDDEARTSGGRGGEY